MAATWTWDRHHEEGIFNEITGSTNIYNKPFLPGVSLQRVLVRVTPYGSSGITGANANRLPSDGVIYATLGIGTELGPVSILAYEIRAPDLLYLRLSDTDPSQYQMWTARYRPVVWDVAARHKNLGLGGTNAVVTLSLEYKPIGTQFTNGVQPIITFYGLQFDALFSQ